ncbi:hypothetical protein YC2023_087541 [Brassica napus]
MPDDRPYKNGATSLNQTEETALVDTRPSLLLPVESLPPSQNQMNRLLSSSLLIDNTHEWKFKQGGPLEEEGRIMESKLSGVNSGGRSRFLESVSLSLYLKPLSVSSDPRIVSLLKERIW